VQTPPPSTDIWRLTTDNGKRTILQHTINILFLFALGSCIGSFLNVVVWRLPRVELPEKPGVFRDFFACFKGLSDPPSHCPKCGNRLKWYDNLPIIGWIKLRGKCRFCHEPISIRYPIVETVTAFLFVGYYVAFFIYQWRACCPQPMVTSNWIDEFGIVHDVTRTAWVFGESWPIYFLYMATVSALLAASLIDAELFIIPIQIPWFIAIVGFIVHAVADRPMLPGSLNLEGGYSPIWMSLSIGSSVGLLITLILWGMKILPTSFERGEVLEIDVKHMREALEQAKREGREIDQQPLPEPYTSKEIRKEISKEMLFLTLPLLLGGLCVAAGVYVPAIRRLLDHVEHVDWLTGLFGSLLGAMAGAFVVWITRILATLAFRRIAMGLGDVHLMFGVGAVIGAGGAVIAFFIAPFFGIVVAIYMLITRKGREIPLGPYLSMATALVMLFYCEIAGYLAPGLQGLLYIAAGVFRH
jgi:leader peptidase (prepilin peptidase)/N-methyltransferase